MLSLKDDLVTGLAIRSGSLAEKDRVGQYFDETTALYLDQYIPGAPVWLSHTYDIDRGQPLADASPIGEMVSYRVQPGVGVWVTTKLTLPHSDPRYAPLAADLKAGKMRYSSDSIQHIASPRIGPDGHIAVWPVAGLSIVHKSHAAEPRLPVRVRTYSRWRM